MIQELKTLLTKRNANVTGVKKESSVLIPLIYTQNQWQLIFERRALTLKSQPGEICFPGGLMEANESSREAAIRETCEELNLTPNQIQILGQIDSIMTSFDMIIHCYVGIIDTPLEAIRPSESEVHELIVIPLTTLTTHVPETYELKSRFDLAHDFPFGSIPNGKNYNFKNTNYPVIFYNIDAYIIWGLTARMLSAFLEIIKSTLK
ncbi:NUDIX hydrolase [Fusibacter tunisiensis]|uniref:8-oxo-dGTP pyrophosphatase MutT (NUDIX family) n=1 Tax=Fusibacter tunisiensis TaxID=1008308 RepID=A0ABS2MTA4_9FIRM|nr:CoA pyrophosphatase [Fusibacter tunisiensis]MBM7562634.1 8-oxo-dGTP pyrophosphatase MutT (NUDIX family) [Fusibacter tunisiensis]